VRAGGGIWIQISHKRTPVWLDLGGQYVWSGRASYLRPGSIDTNSSPPVVHPITSETHLWMIHVGVAAGLVPKIP
jgi:hypothetical protein